MTSLSHLAGMTVKVDREYYPLIIAVRLNPFQYITNMTSLSHLAGMTVKVDREHYPLIIAVRLNPYQYVYKRSKYCPS